MSILQTERMNCMKKAMKLFAVLFTALFVLLGCAKEETATFELKQEGLVSTLVYYYKGDVVTKQTAKSEIDLKKLPISEEEALKKFQENTDLYNSVKGVTATQEVKDGIVTQFVTVDYTVAKLSDLKKVIPSDFSGQGDKVSFKASKEALIKAGYTEK